MYVEYLASPFDIYRVEGDGWFDESNTSDVVVGSENNLRRVVVGNRPVFGCIESAIQLSLVYCNESIQEREPEGEAVDIKHTIQIADSQRCAAGLRNRLRCTWMSFDGRLSVTLELSVSGV